jgi:hypothetical protein
MRGVLFPLLPEPIFVLSSILEERIQLNLIFPCCAWERARKGQAHPAFHHFVVTVSSNTIARDTAKDTVNVVGFRFRKSNNVLMGLCF